MISKQLIHPDFHHSLGKDNSSGTLSTKDKALGDLTKVNVPSQHRAAIFVSQFHSLSFLSVKCIVSWNTPEMAQKMQSSNLFSLPLNEPCIQDDAGARAWGRFLATVIPATDTSTSYLLVQQGRKEKWDE